MKQSRKIKGNPLKDFLANGIEVPSINGITVDNFESKLSSSLSFYQRSNSIKDAKKSLILFAPEVSKIVTSLVETKFSEYKTLGFVCKFFLDNKLPKDFHEKTSNWIKDKISEILLLTVEKHNVHVESEKLVINHCGVDKSSEYIYKIDEYVDEFIFNEHTTGFNVIEYIKDCGLNADNARKIYSHFQKELNEYNEINSDPQLKEAYHHLSKERIKEIKKFYIKLLSDIDSFINIATKPKQRTLELITPKKLIEKVVYQKESVEINNLVSLSPEKIIGASLVLLYNEKYKKLTILKGKELTIKGTTVIGFNENESKMKPLRNPSMFLNKFKSVNEIELNELWKEVRSNEAEATGRIGKDTIIISVF